MLFILYKFSSYLESFSHYIFPGLHERNNVSCDVDQDCVRDNIDINTVECIKRTGPSDEYKVCVCKRGWFLNPLTQTCGKSLDRKKRL